MIQGRIVSIPGRVWTWGLLFLGALSMSEDDTPAVDDAVSRAGDSVCRLARVLTLWWCEICANKNIGKEYGGKSRAGKKGVGSRRIREVILHLTDRGGHAQHQPDCAEAAQHAAN